MYETRTIAGYECNCITSKQGELRQITIMVGERDKPGMRSKDGDAARAARRDAKSAVVAATGLPAKKVRVASRYTELSEQADGTIARRDSQGKVIGVYAK